MVALFWITEGLVNPSFKARFLKCLFRPTLIDSHIMRQSTLTFTVEKKEGHYQEIILTKGEDTKARRLYYLAQEFG